jgi:predicted SprT family Zn-dependent metalloprotease
MELNAIAKLARLLLNGHGLRDWTCGFDSARRRCGRCRYRRKLITLSRHYVRLNSLEEITDTILHEIAHALVGSHEGHGPLWQAKCREIGAVPQHCSSEDVVMPPRECVATCGGCGLVFRRHRCRKGL